MHFRIIFRNSESFPFIKLIYLISWTKSVCFSRQFILKYRKSNAFHPTIAQLAERETVEAKQLSLGHWFESGWTETFFNFYGFQLVFPSSVLVTSQTILWPQILINTFIYGVLIPVLTLFYVQCRKPNYSNLRKVTSSDWLAE